MTSMLSVLQEIVLLLNCVHDPVSFLFDMEYLSNLRIVYLHSYCGVTGLGSCANTKFHPYEKSVQSLIIVDADGHRVLLCELKDFVSVTLEMSHIESQQKIFKSVVNSDQGLQLCV